jgi:hypothetical protein
MQNCFNVTVVTLKLLQKIVVLMYCAFAAE